MFTLGLISQPLPTVWLNIPITVVQILDDNGRASFFGPDQTPFNEQSARQMIQAVNQLFVPARIQFNFLTDRPFEYKKSSYMFNDIDPVQNLSIYRDRSTKPPETGRSERIDLFRRVVAEKPKSLHIFLRRGNEYEWNERTSTWGMKVGYSRGDSQFVRIASKDVRVWAHELGHLMGLPHTCKEGVDAPRDFGSRAAVESALGEFDNRNPSEDPFLIFDGDADLGISDTPLDPGPSFWKAVGKPFANLTFEVNGKPYSRVFDRRNIMHATAELGGFSKDQMTAMRSIACFWVNGLPSNVRESSEMTFEFENCSFSLPETQKKKTLRIGGTTPDHSCLMFDLKPEAEANFRFEKVPNGKYEVWLSGMRGSDHGAFNVSVQSSQMFSVSLYSVGRLKKPSKAETGWIKLGPVTVLNGKLELKLVGTEHTGFSNGYTVGLDALKLVPVTETVK